MSKSKQILFNFLLKRPLYEIGSKNIVCIKLVDLNGLEVRPKDVEEFQKLIIIQK